MALSQQTVAKCEKQRMISGKDASLRDHLHNRGTMTKAELREIANTFEGKVTRILPKGEQNRNKSRTHRAKNRAIPLTTTGIVKSMQNCDWQPVLIKR